MAHYYKWSIIFSVFTLFVSFRFLMWTTILMILMPSEVVPIVDVFITRVLWCNDL